MSGMLTRASLRAFSTEPLKVVNNVAKQQFMVSMYDVEAVLSYDKNGDRVTFIHTDVPEQFKGKGIGKLLAENAFNYAQDNNLNVTCQCHFLCAYYKKNITKYKSLNIELEE